MKIGKAYHYSGLPCNANSFFMDGKLLISVSKKESNGIMCDSGYTIRFTIPDLLKLLYGAIKSCFTTSK